MRDQLLRTASDEHFAVITYCFMPDHLHLLVEGLEDDADLRRFAKMLKQWTTVAYRRSRRGRLWQEGYYEHVLRDDESTLDVARYVLANPVRGGLVREPKDYPFSGSGVYSIEEILECFVLADRE